MKTEGVQFESCLMSISPDDSLPHHHPVGQLLAGVHGRVRSGDVEEGGDGLVAQRSPTQPGISGSGKRSPGSSQDVANGSVLDKTYVLDLNPTHVSGKLVSLGVPGFPENWFPFVDEVVGMSHTVLVGEIKSFDLKNGYFDGGSYRLWGPIQQHGGQLGD